MAGRTTQANRYPDREPQGSMSANEAAKDDELATMGDIEFLTLCRTVRRVAELTPADELDSEARAKLEQVNAEFLRRAGIAWQRVS
jgi:hypothetical protein